MKNYFFFLLISLFFGCKKTTSECNKPARNNPKFTLADTKKEKVFEMYTMTELAKLMEKMYADQLRIKKQILAKKEIGAYSNYIEEIKFAKMTEASDDDAFYQQMSDAFISSQKNLFTIKENKILNYNKGIDLCIQCHSVKCSGPISRIKKLYISK